MTACAQCGIRVLDGESIATLHGASICRACYERTCNPHHGRPPEYGRLRSDGGVRVWRRKAMNTPFRHAEFNHGG